VTRIGMIIVGCALAYLLGLIVLTGASLLLDPAPLPAGVVPPTMPTPTYGGPR
jgi:hypothetical protein